MYVLFLQFSGSLKTGLHHIIVVPGKCCIEQSYNRTGLLGKPVSISSYLADPTLMLLKEAAASLVFMAAAASVFQPTITNCVIIYSTAWDYVCLKLLCSSSLSGTISVDGLCCWKWQDQRWSWLVSCSSAHGPPRNCLLGFGLASYFL